MLIAAPLLVIDLPPLPAHAAALRADLRPCAGADPRRRLHLRARAARLLAAGPARARAQPVRPHRPLHAGLRPGDGGARDPAARGDSCAGGRMAAFLCVCVALAVSAVYELIEWGAALGAGAGRGGVPRHAGRSVGHAGRHVPRAARRHDGALAAIGPARPVSSRRRYGAAAPALRELRPGASRRRRRSSRAGGGCCGAGSPGACRSPRSFRTQSSAWHSAGGSSPMAEDRIALRTRTSMPSACSRFRAW